MRLLPLCAAAFALAAAAPASADLEVKRDQDGLVVEHTGVTPVRAAVEPFGIGRPAARFRRLEASDQPITTTAEDCTGSDAADMVECLLEEEDRITLAGSDLDDRWIVGTAGAPCEPVQIPDQTNLFVDLGDGADRLETTNGCEGEVFPFTIRALGGDGDDTITGGLIFDDLFGRAGADTIDGGGGSDTMAGNAGQDTLRGGPGNDNFSEFGAVEADVIDGGGGDDDLSYAQREGALSITLDGEANDGAEGENDNVTSIEGFEMKSRTDDTIVAGNGEGRFETGPGDDTVTAGGGKDDVLTGPGDDVIDHLDGVKDFLNCGPGYDEAVVDRREEVLTRYGPGERADQGCERLLRYAKADGAPAQVVERELDLRGTRLSLRLKCPTGGPRCKGTLSVYDPRYQTDRFASFPTNPFLADDPRYARERYSVAAGRTARMTLDVTAAGAAVGRDRGLATYAAEKGASGKPRTALNTLLRRG